MTMSGNRSHDTGVSHEGLPQASDYDPTQIGEAELEAGEPTQTWPRFGLEMVPVRVDGEDTGRRLIRRNGDYVASVTGSYNLLPNERAVAAANEVARDLDMEPFHEFGDESDWFIELDDHVFQNSERTRVHALYAHEQGTVAGDDMSYGVAVHNSIDGSLAFRVSLFSFRHACANMIWMGTGTVKELAAEQVESEREVLRTDVHKHTDGLSVDRDSLRTLIEDVTLATDGVTDAYREWAQRRVTQREARELIERREKNYLSGGDVPEWVDDAVEAVAHHVEARGEISEEIYDEIVRAHRPDETSWSVFNDLTDAVWHNEDTEDETKRRKMKQVNRVFDPTE